MAALGSGGFRLEAARDVTTQPGRLEARVSTADYVMRRRLKALEPRLRGSGRRSAQNDKSDSGGGERVLHQSDDNSKPLEIRSKVGQALARVEVSRHPQAQAARCRPKPVSSAQEADDFDRGRAVVERADPQLAGGVVAPAFDRAAA